MEDNKPLETDAPQPQDENLDELFEETPEETPEESEESPEEAGKKDVEPATKEDFLDTVKKVTGREFKSPEDFEKHYKNLASFVGKKQEDKPAVKSEVKPSADLSDINQKILKMEFLGETPDAKSHFETFVKPLADGQGISYAEAWEKIKPLVDAGEAQKTEKEIGVNSKNRIAPPTNSQLKKLEETAKTGSQEAQEAYIAEKFKAMGL